MLTPGPYPLLQQHLAKMISSARSTSSNLLQMAFENGSSPSGPSAQVSPELFKQGVLEHAVWLGMDPEKDKKFLWIAERR